MADTLDLFIDLYAAPTGFKDDLIALGIKWREWDPQPMADQIRLRGCEGVPVDLPDWIRSA